MGGVLSDNVREGGIVCYGRGSVIDPQLKGNGHTCVGQEKAWRKGGRLRKIDAWSCTQYISQ